MNKALAEIIAGIIPHKRIRNQWRGILRYGPIKAAKLRIKMKRCTAIPKYYFAICAIAKNEGPYFKEWIEWHKKMGVDKFYIYDNESTDQTKEVLTPYIESGLVEYIYYPGSKKQLAAYDDCIEKHRLDTRWLAYIDLDEFLVPKKDKTVALFLKRMEHFSTIEVNWLIYGSSGAKTKEPGDIMKRFYKHSKPEDKVNQYIKSIFNPKDVCCVVGCHEVARISGCAATPDGKKIKIHYRDRKPQQEILCINHYAIKSYEEFLNKRARGRARTTAIRDLDYFKRYDLNDIEESI